MTMDARESRPARVLVVDDEAALTRLVDAYLEREGFAVDVAADGHAAVDAVRRWAPDVVVLDLGLPGMDGIEVCRAVRGFSDCYIVMLTARVTEADRVTGLVAGADDYLTKPFSPRELVARVRALLRRPRLLVESVIQVGSLRVDVAGRQVQVGNTPVDLTRIEFDVLAAMAARPHLAFTRRELIDVVWGADWVGDDHLVDVHIGHIRRKLGDDAADPAFITTVRGVGYRMGAGR